MHGRQFAAPRCSKRGWLGRQGRGRQQCPMDDLSDTKRKENKNRPEAWVRRMSEIREAGRKEKRGKRKERKRKGWMRR